MKISSYCKEDPFIYDLLSLEIEEKLRRSSGFYLNQFPHVSNRYNYDAKDNQLWTAGFYPGMMYLAYDLTGDPFFISHMNEYLNNFESRLKSKVRLTHDLGFLYTLSCVACYKTTGNLRAQKIALEAADILAKRYRSNGQFIQAWGPMDQKEESTRMIIDTMLNLPLLYWTANEQYMKIARNHAETTARLLIRKDYSTYHTYLMDIVSGAGIRGATHQGFSDESTWARGQAWAVYGFALSYSYTKEDKFLDIAIRCADFFLEHLPERVIPYWDFSFSDDTPDCRDSSAAAIFVCGLLELAKWVDNEKKLLYRQYVYQIIRSLFDQCFDHNPDQPGLLKEGLYHRDDGAKEFVAWGDYFFFEAIVRLKKDWKMFW